MSSDLRDQIYEQMNQKETDDLLDIWVMNDRTEWSDEVFEIIRQIFIQRGVNYPDQDEPIYARKETASAKGIDSDGLEEWEAKVLDNDDQPDFYDTLEVLNLHKMLNRTAKASIAIYSVLGFFRLPFAPDIMTGTFPSNQQLMSATPVIITTLLAYGLQILLFYYSLKALGSILRILMEMEFNSRRAS
jgi:hypothetical protein